MVKHKTEDLSIVFSALADPTRRAILERLSTGAASVTELAQPFSMSLPAISKHLAVLGDAGLTETEKDGRFRRMHLKSGPLKEAADWLDKYEKFWIKRFDSLEAVLAAPKHSKK